MTARGPGFPPVPAPQALPKWSGAGPGRPRLSLGSGLGWGASLPLLEIDGHNVWRGDPSAVSDGGLLSVAVHWPVKGSSPLGLVMF